MNLKLKPGETTTIDPQKGQQDAIATDDQKKLRKLIERTHPQYDSKLPHWQFLAQTYEGGRDWFKTNVFRYIKEGDREFEDRLGRAYRFNHTREVVDLLNKYLFKQEITRSKDAPPSVQKFWKRATKNGMSITELMRHASKANSIGGRIGIVVDNNAPATPLSKADEKRLGIRTYAYIVGPDQLRDYGFDEDGNLNWVLIKERSRDDSDPYESSGDVEDRFRLWTKESWVLYREVTGRGRLKRIEVVASNKHGLGQVPVVLADNIVSDDEYGAPSLIDDIAYLDRAVANYLSNLDAIIQDQAFSQLAMPAQGLMPGEDAYAKMLEMGTKRIFLFDGEAGQVPFYLSPDVKQAGILLEVINKIISEIYHSVGLAGERTKQDNAVGIDNSSGVAKAYDFERVNALLVSKADSLEMVENRLAQVVALWSGETMPEDDTVTYPDTFDTRGLYDEFDIAARLALIDAPPAIRREQMESVVTKLFPQLSKDLVATIRKELKEWPGEEEVPPLPQTGTGQRPDQKPSPANTSNQGAVSKKDPTKVGEKQD